MFQHDNARSNVTRICTQILEAENVPVLPWPSPDLNPIEHLWDELKRRLRARSNCPTSVSDLTNALVAEWQQVPAAMFLHLVESLPRRVEAAISAKE
uniref:Tc1-like transposase DDE domain-containing protein n=1 Tax=Salmo trutta TaxID=8032 RepID=A0A673VX79_SALTR